MTKEQESRCNLIIHGAAGAAGAVGAGLAQIPAADAALIAPIQVSMILALGRVFDVEIPKTLARSVTYATFGTIMGKGISKAAFRLVPVVGNVVNAGVAAGVTEALGWTVVRQLEDGTLGA
jgi:uncharacterized protein (DUF697 family)